MKNIVIKSLAVFALLAIVGVAFASCSGDYPYSLIPSQADVSDNQESSYQESGNDESWYSEPDTSYTTEESTPSVSQAPDVTEESYTMYFNYESGRRNEVSEFENGMAVNAILYRHDTDTRLYIGLINTKGEILYKLDTGKGLETQIKFETVRIGEKLACFEYDGTYYLVNAAGKEIFRTADETEVILGIGEVNALIYKKIADINSAVEKIGVLDYSGEWTMPLTPIGDLGIDSLGRIGAGLYDYLGEDYYEVGGLQILNYKTKAVKYVKLPNSMEKFTFGEMKNGQMLLYNYPGLTYAGPHSTCIYVYNFKDGKVYYIFDEDYCNCYVYESLQGNRIIYKFSQDRKNASDPESDMYYYSCVLNDNGKPELFLYLDYKTASAKYSLSGTTYGQGITRIEWNGVYFIAYIHGADDKDYFVVLNGDMDAVSAPIRISGSVASCYDDEVLFYNEHYDQVLMKFDGTIVNDSFPDYDEEYPDFGFGVFDHPMGFRDVISRVGYESSSLTETIITAHAYINEKGEIIFNELIDKSTN